MDHDAALGLSHQASPEEIRPAYGRLAKEYHPDVSKLPDAQQRFVRITEAYEVLRDPARRSRDLTRHSPSPRRAAPRQEPRYEQEVRRYQQDARARAEKFSRMSCFMCSADANAPHLREQPRARPVPVRGAGSAP